jgi:hypothetical protein
MIWQTFTDDRGQRFMVSTEALLALSYDLAWALGLYERSRKQKSVDENGTTVWNVVTTREKGYREAIARSATTIYREALQILQNNADVGVRHLAGVRASVRKYTRLVDEMRQDTSRKTMQSISGKVALGEAGLAISSGVAGGSVIILSACVVPVAMGAGVLGAAATTPSAVAGLQLAGMAGSLSAFKKYQETGNVGSTAITGVMDFATALFPFAAAKGMFQMVVMVVVQAHLAAGLEVAKSLLEGDSRAKALTKGVAGFVSKSLFGILGGAVADRVTRATTDALQKALAESAISMVTEWASSTGTDVVVQNARLNARHRPSAGGALNGASAAKGQPLHDNDYIRLHVARRYGDSVGSVGLYSDFRPTF